jgi:hypothetical protein
MVSFVSLVNCYYVITALYIVLLQSTALLPSIMLLIMTLLPWNVSNILFYNLILDA